MSACQPDTLHPYTRLNPSPKMRYEITLEINGAPGPFDSVSGVMLYEVVNKSCVPVTDSLMNPLRLMPQANLQITFDRVSENVYRTVVYSDYFQDEDYFGLGICHWSLKGSIARLKIKKNTMAPYLSSEQFFSQQPVLLYFTKDSYLNGDMEVSFHGESVRSNYSADVQDELFSISIIAEEVAP